MIRQFHLFSFCVLVILLVACTGGSSAPVSPIISTSTPARLTDTPTPVRSALTDLDKTATAQPPLHATPIVHTTDTPATAGLNVAIRIDGATRYQTISGFGASFMPFNRPGNKMDDPNAPAHVSATDAQRDAMIQIWFRQLGLARARIFPSDFEPVNDNDNPSVLNPAGFDWTPANQLTDFVRLAKPVGLPTYWASFSIEIGDKQGWLRKPDSCSLDPNKIDEEVEWLYAAALHFKELGEELPYMTINNEPDLSACKDRVKIEIGDYVVIVKRLGARLRAAGIATRIVVSDGWIPQNVLRYAEAVLADPDARQYVGAIAYHAYADGYDDPATLLNNSAASNPPHAAVEVRQQIRDLAARSSLPVWLTEICYCTPRSSAFSEFELLRARLNHLHDELTIANVAAFDTMNLYNIRRPGVYDELIEVFYRPDGTIERYQIATYGYLFGQYSRFIIPGSVRVNADSNNARVRVVAFQRPDGKLVIVALNNNASTIQANIALSGLSQMPSALTVLSSRDGAIWQTPPDVSVNGAAATVVLAPLSVTTYVSR